MSKIRVIISGGGTAGHIFPALSIADELNLQENKIVKSVMIMIKS